MARVSMATLLAEIESLKAALASAPVASAEANAHYVARDIPCAVSKDCKWTGRTAERAAIHGIEKGGHAFRKTARKA